MGQLESKPKGYHGELLYLNKKTDLLVEKINQKLVQVIDKVNKHVSNSNFIYTEFLVEIWHKDISGEELDSYLIDLLKNIYKSWSVLLKRTPKITEGSSNSSLIQRRPDVKLCLTRGSVNFRSYLIVFQNMQFNRKNKIIYPYLYLSDKFDIFRADECVSCLETEPKILAEPCGHLSLCIDCYQDWDSRTGSRDSQGYQICPSCQSKVYRYTIYFEDKSNSSSSKLDSSSFTII